MLFNCAPCTKYFSGEVLLRVHTALREFYELCESKDPAALTMEHMKKFHSFSKYSSFTELNKSELKYTETPIYHQDEHLELIWRIKRPNMGDMDIIWTYFSRARLPKKPALVADNPVVLESTRIKSKTVVRLKNIHIADIEKGANNDDLTKFFASRYHNR